MNREEKKKKKKLNNKRENKLHFRFLFTNEKLQE